MSGAGSDQTQSTSEGGALAYSPIIEFDAAQDTASIRALPGELSGDLPIRQDRIDALRAQIEAGTYTVKAHAVANAMLQNLFRS